MKYKHLTLERFRGEQYDLDPFIHGQPYGTKSFSNTFDKALDIAVSCGWEIVHVQLDIERAINHKALLRKAL